nr:MAG: hypothetical protein 1 [Tombusviridae sp.]
MPSNADTNTLLRFRREAEIRILTAENLADILDSVVVLLLNAERHGRITFSRAVQDAATLLRHVSMSSYERPVRATTLDRELARAMVDLVCRRNRSLRSFYQRGQSSTSMREARLAVWVARLCDQIGNLRRRFPRRDVVRESEWELSSTYSISDDSDGGCDATHDV